MSDSIFGCVFCLKKTSSLKNKSTADVLKDLDLFQFLCKYLLNNENNSIPFNFDSIEEGMLPVCTKCTNGYKQLAELYSEYQELETQIKSVVEEFREFVFSSSEHEDEQNTSDFHRTFRQQILQGAGSSQDMGINIKEEVIIPDELEMENIMTMSMDTEYNIGPTAEEDFDNPSDDDFEETQPDNFSFVESNDEQQSDDEEEESKSEIVHTRDAQTDETNRRRSLRTRDTPLSIKKEHPKAKTKSTKKRAKVTAKKVIVKKVKPELESDSSMSSMESDSSGSSTDADYVPKRNRTDAKIGKIGRPKIVGPRKFICSLKTCGIELENIHSLHAHAKKHESDTPEKDKKLSCKVCKKLFAVQRNLKRHLSLHKLQQTKKEDLFICQECDIRCKTQETLDRHILEIHQKDEVKYVCTICGNKYKSHTGFQSHLKGHAGVQTQRPRQEKFQCKSCPEVFSSYKRIKAHRVLKHPEKTAVYPCTICENKYFKKSSLDTHLLTHSDGKSKTHDCEICLEKFKTKTGLFTHNIRKHRKDPFTCTLCKNIFSSRSEINTHTCSVIVEFEGQAKKDDLPTTANE